MTMTYTALAQRRAVKTDHSISDPRPFRVCSPAHRHRIYISECTFSSYRRDTFFFLEDSRLP